MNTDALKSIIEDAHKLAKADIAPDLVKPAVETIALRLERLVKNGLYITPKTVVEAAAGVRPFDAILKDPPLEMAAAPEEKTGNAVGITSNAKHVLAWSYTDDNDIRVVGDVCAPGQMQISAYENKKLVLIGSVFGGRWLAIRLARFVRNGLVSHRMKRRRNKQNRAARKAAAIEAANV